MSAGIRNSTENFTPIQPEWMRDPETSVPNPVSDEDAKSATTSRKSASETSVVDKALEVGKEIKDGAEKATKAVRDTHDGLELAKKTAKKGQDILEGVAERATRDVLHGTGDPVKALKTLTRAKKARDRLKLLEKGAGGASRLTGTVLRGQKKLANKALYASAKGLSKVVGKSAARMVPVLGQILTVAECSVKASMAGAENYANKTPTAVAVDATLAGAKCLVNAATDIGRLGAGVGAGVMSIGECTSKGAGQLDNPGDNRNIFAKYADVISTTVGCVGRETIEGFAKTDAVVDKVFDVAGDQIRKQLNISE